MTHDLCYMKSVTLFSEVLIMPPQEEHATLILKPQRDNRLLFSASSHATFIRFNSIQWRLEL